MRDARGEQRVRRILQATALALAVVAAACGGTDEGTKQGAAACAGCHAAEVETWESFSSHRALFGCDLCHAETSRTPGPGHRESPACAECHSEARHPPAAAPAGTPSDDAAACLRCHDPHGSTNLLLVRERLRVGRDAEAEVVFRSLAGRADDSFAELARSDGGENEREPGSGLCEVCHAATRFYDRQGTGAPHPTRRCTQCHDHARGFLAGERLE